MFLIAFDLDGTLIDSAAGIHASLVAACAALDVPPPSLEQLQRHIGPLKPAPLAARVLERSGLPGAAAAAGYRFVAAGYGYGGDLDAVDRIKSPLELLHLSLNGLPW